MSPSTETTHPSRRWYIFPIAWLIALPLVFAVAGALATPESREAKPVGRPGEKAAYSAKARASYWIFQSVDPNSGAGISCQSSRQDGSGVTGFSASLGYGFFGVFKRPPAQVVHNGVTYYYAGEESYPESYDMRVSCGGGPVLVEQAPGSVTSILFGIAVVASPVVWIGVVLTLRSRSRRR